VDDEKELPTWDDEKEKDEEYINIADIFLNGTLFKEVHVPDFGINPMEELYVGSPHSARDFCRYMMALKASLVLGEQAYAVIVGAVLSFLPPQNVIALCLDRNPSVYKIVQVISVFAGFESSLRTYEFATCKDGCATFQNHQHFCYYCDACKWKHCLSECYHKRGGNTVSICSHPKQPAHRVYYMPIRDRISLLLQSDLKNLLWYDKYRKRSNKV
jgi:hypothetical protein